MAFLWLGKNTEINGVSAHLTFPHFDGFPLLLLSVFTRPPHYMYYVAEEKSFPFVSKKAKYWQGEHFLWDKRGTKSVDLGQNGVIVGQILSHTPAYSVGFGGIRVIPARRKRHQALFPPPTKSLE